MQNLIAEMGGLLRGGFSSPLRATRSQQRDSRSGPRHRRGPSIIEPDAIVIEDKAILDDRQRQPMAPGPPQSWRQSTAANTLDAVGDYAKNDAKRVAAMSRQLAAPCLGATGVRHIAELLASPRSRTSSMPMLRARPPPATPVRQRDNELRCSAHLASSASC